MEEGVFPSEMSKYSEADLEEERRLAYVGITRAKKELYISNSVTRMLYGRTQRNEPSRFLREIEPEYIEETRSPVLEQRSRLGGWGSGYGSDTVPGGASGYSGPSGWGRAASGYGSGYGSRSGYLNREYNAPMSNNRGFGSDYAGRGSASSGHGGCSSGSGSSGFGAGYGRPAAPKAPVKPAGGGVTSSPRPAAASTGPKHYEPGDIVEHKGLRARQGAESQARRRRPDRGDQLREGGREEDHGQLCAPCEDNDGGIRKMMTVRLIAHTPEPEKVVAAAAKLCYSDAHITDLLDGLDEEKTARFLTMLSDLGHASPIEHASFTFGIEGVSRTLLAQITRHRIASFSVQSQRYVRLDDFRYVIPPEIEAIPRQRRRSSRA